MTALDERTEVLTSRRLLDLVDTVIDTERLDLTASSLANATTDPEPRPAPLDVSRAWEAVDPASAPATLAAYRADWTRFTRWCVEHGRPALPAAPAVVAEYLTAVGRPAGSRACAPSTLVRWVSAINKVHLAHGMTPPGQSAPVRSILAEARQARDAGAPRSAPLALDDLRAMLAAIEPERAVWPTAVAARRDTALLLLGFAGALRRSELIELTLADVTIEPAVGLRIRGGGAGHRRDRPVRMLPFGQDPVTCAPCAWTAWRQILDAWDGADPAGGRRAVLVELHRRPGGERPGHVCRDAVLEPVGRDAPRAQRSLFPGVHRSGAIAGTAMTGEAVRKMVRRRAQGAGVTEPPGASLGAHSLRSGFITEALRRGADPRAVMAQTGHRDLAAVQAYAHRVAPPPADAVALLDL
ncbi:integrase [Nakamurella flava]|uniref:Integrase n=1 Tax=Nakamurella flava TaxID=2576308 RepID=A0A4U6QAW2_9ACTN|nr:tyrosine-type recombinase/integrase [Nakamurella flava]TKV57042.1 integrase [Nakamurella flava]